jgi:fibro-slime domain-containing protein
MKGHSMKQTILTALGLVTAAGFTLALIPQDADARAAASMNDPFSNMPDSIELTGVVRDFKAHGQSNGHPDFQRYNRGHTVGLVEDYLDDDGKPMLKHTKGQRVGSQYRDKNGNNINPAMFDAEAGDRPGSLSSQSGDSITSADSFRSWFRDDPNYNLSMTHNIVLDRQPGTNKYVFHQHDDSSMAGIQGFFPADGKLWNDHNQQYGHNYYLTFELETEFIYQADREQVFTFVGDDDVWVFINGELVIDLGGVHGAVSQTIDLSRLNLSDGQKCTLTLFFAERHTTRSNFRVETTLNLRTAELPNTFNLYD